MDKVLVIGGGASGLMAAAQLALEGDKVCLLEKNEKLGKKLYITGKGRCNLTNACTREELFGAVVSNSKFLYPAFTHFDNLDAMDFFERAGLSLKVERGQRVFPVSDHASDVTRCLERIIEKHQGEILLDTEVKEILCRDGRVVGCRLEDGSILEAEAVLVATGGLSYPSTGSTGDGYLFAREMGHQVTDLMPSLVPLRTRETYVRDLEGLALKNVLLSIRKGKKTLFQDQGELLFTRDGITGPLALTASARVGRKIGSEGLSAFVNLKPALSPDQLDARLVRELSLSPTRHFKNAVASLFPASLTPVMVRLSGIDPDKQAAAITRQERLEFGNLIFHLPLTLIGLRGYNEAVITKGGICVKEVDPSTMESKLVKGLYFIGEVLDLDAVTGGFNLQISWSTASLAAAAVHARAGKNQR